MGCTIAKPIVDGIEREYRNRLHVIRVDIQTAAGASLDDMVGRGTGIGDKGLARKKEVIAQGIALNRPAAADGVESRIIVVADNASIFLLGLVHQNEGTAATQAATAPIV